jgi:hypothetical protein
MRKINNKLLIPELFLNVEMTLLKIIQKWVASSVVVFLNNVCNHETQFIIYIDVRLFKKNKCEYSPLKNVPYLYWLFVCFMVFNATFNNTSVISWRSVLLVEETGEPEETTNLPQVTDTLYHIMLYTLPWSKFELRISLVIGTDCISIYSCKSNYHTITTIGILDICRQYIWDILKFKLYLLC